MRKEESIEQFLKRVSRVHMYKFRAEWEFIRKHGSISKPWKVANPSEIEEISNKMSEKEKTAIHLDYEDYTRLKNIAGEETSGFEASMNREEFVQLLIRAKRNYLRSARKVGLK